MFGLMKIATHEAEMQKVIDELGGNISLYEYLHDASPVDCAVRMRKNFERLSSEKASLKARIVELEAKISAHHILTQASLNTVFKNAALKTRLGDCPEHLLSKIDKNIKKGARRTGSRFKLTEAAKAPVKGKAK